MPDVNAVIVREGDDPPWPDIDLDKIVLPDASWDVAILQAGMSSGLPSVMLRIELPDGTTMLAETSLALWSAVTIMARAAFPEAFAGGPLDPAL